MKLDHASVVYVDDLYLQGDSYQIFLQNVLGTINKLRELGFVKNLEKSSLNPTQTMIFLGFVFSSKNMTLTLTDKKRAEKTKCNCKELGKL